MPLQHLIDTYGYLAILVGTFLEGETILVLGGIAAKLGYLKLNWVIVWAFTGTVLADQLFFLLGRYRGHMILRRYPSWQPRAAKAGTILERHRIPIILGFRFLYGLRTVTPFVIGMSRVPIMEFALLNIVSAAIWAATIGSLGYALGQSMEVLLGDIKHYEVEIMAGILLLGLVIWFIFFLRTHRRKK